MTGTTSTPPIAPKAEAKIQATLAAISTREDVRILFAIESGSRAWGFPSPDSDYDVRFVYARPVDWYLSISPGRDVIELPLDGVFDVNGWDIKKALGLLLKPNPVLLEWLSSPIRYQWDDAVCRKLIALAERIAHGPACIHHYLNLGKRQWSVYIEDKDRINLKKYFYVVRPAMALRWIRMHPQAIPPMNFQELLVGVDLPTEIVANLVDLLERKSRTKELGEAPRLIAVDAFIMDEFDRAREAASSADRPDDRPDDEADALFRTIVKETPA